jgi:hypothetical protein
MIKEDSGSAPSLDFSKVKNFTISHLVLIKSLCHKNMPALKLDSLMMKSCINSDCSIQRMLCWRIARKLIDHHCVAKGTIEFYLTWHTEKIKSYLQDSKENPTTEFVNSSRLEYRFFLLFLLSYSSINMDFGLWDRFDITNDILVEIYSDNDTHMIEVMNLSMMATGSISILLVFLDSIGFDCMVLFNFVLNEELKFLELLHIVAVIIKYDPARICKFLTEMTGDGETDYFCSFQLTMVELEQKCKRNPDHVKPLRVINQILQDCLNSRGQKTYDKQVNSVGNVNVYLMQKSISARQSKF